jgi:hypothetical protein
MLHVENDVSGEWALRGTLHITIRNLARKIIEQRSGAEVQRCIQEKQYSFVRNLYLRQRSVMFWVSSL